jgi:hypothetical protein
VAKSDNKPPDNYQERISALEKRLEAAVEEHRRMRRELEALQDRDPYRLLRPFLHIDDDAWN